MQPHTTPSIPWLRNCYLLFRTWPTASRSRVTLSYDKLYITLSRRCCKQNRLTTWGRVKMAVIFQTIYSNAFSWMKMNELRLRFHWKLFPRVKIKNIPSMVHIMAWRQPGDKPLSEAMMISLLTHISVTGPQWVNNLASICLSIMGESKFRRMEFFFFSLSC